MKKWFQNISTDVSNFKSNHYFFQCWYPIIIHEASIIEWSDREVRSTEVVWCQRLGRCCHVCHTVPCQQQGGTFHLWYFMHNSIVFQFPAIRLQQHFAHATPAMLAWHVQNFAAIICIVLDKIRFKFGAKYHEWNVSHLIACCMLHACKACRPCGAGGGVFCFQSNINVIAAWTPQGSTLHSYCHEIVLSLKHEYLLQDQLNDMKFLKDSHIKYKEKIMEKYESEVATQDIGGVKTWILNGVMSAFGYGLWQQHRFCRKDVILCKRKNAHKAHKSYIVFHAEYTNALVQK